MIGFIASPASRSQLRAALFFSEKKNTRARSSANARGVRVEVSTTFSSSVEPAR